MKVMNLVSLMDRYDTDAKCRDLLEAIGWPSGIACLQCGDTDVGEDPAAGSGGARGAAIASA